MHTNAQSKHDQTNAIKQPLTPEALTPEEHEKQAAAVRNENLTVNPGDRIDRSNSLEENARQVAVNAPDITGDHIVVPTYFIIKDADGNQKALHHVRDAEEISDVIRLARMDENGNRHWW